MLRELIINKVYHVRHIVFELFIVALKSAQTGKPVCYYVVRVCFLYIVLAICR